MDGLRPSQLDLLARHRERALDVLLPASAAFDGRARLRDTSHGKTLLGQSPELLVSVGVSAAAAAVERRRLLQRHAAAQEIVRIEAADLFPDEVLRELKRRRLPFEPSDVELLLDLGASSMDPDHPLPRSFQALSFAVSAARRLLRDRPTQASVAAALERAASSVDGLAPAPASTDTELLGRIRALLAANVPGGLLDLSVLDPRDAWAKPAEEVLRDHASRWDGVQRFVALVARAHSTRPAAAWRRDAESLAREYAGLADLLRELLEPVLRIDLSTSGVPWPPGWLLAPPNETLVRGTTWATATVDEPWIVPLLGRLALRGAAPAPQPTVTTPLSHKLASASIETLAVIGTAEARDELRVLLGELRRRDLLKRIAAAVGEPANETLARDERIRREKLREVRRKSDPEPRRRQQQATRWVLRDLAPLLRDSGFADSVGRSFWRDLDDRVEALHCKAWSGGLTLELGIWFRFVPRPRQVAERHGRARPSVHDCDLRGNVQTWHDELRDAGADAERWFLQWRPLPAVLRWLLVGKASGEVFGPGPQGSPQHTLLTGYVARELGEEKVARKRLAAAAAYYRETLDETSAEPSEDPAASWVAQLEADAGR